MGYDRNDRGREWRNADSRDRDFSRGQSYGQYGYGDRDQNSRGGYGGGDRGYGRDEDYRSYGEDRYRGRDDSFGDSSYYGVRGRYDQPRGGQGRYEQGRSGRSGSPPSGYDYNDRGFFDRAGDEVRSWFGDEEAERRREYDARYDAREYGTRDNRHNDRGYSDWRNRQIEALDRDYHEYRTEHQSKFDQEFGSWREKRTTQRGSLRNVTEHMEVVGRDGEHIGTVDKVRGDRIILTKTDADAKGHHHSIPSSWIESVSDKVTVSKTADEAQARWRDEEQRSALFGDDDRASSRYDYARYVGFF